VLAAIKHSATEIILFLKENSTSLHCACNAIQLQRKKVSISLLLRYTPNNQLLNTTDYKISRFILQHEHKLLVNKAEKMSTYWHLYWKAVILHLSENMLCLCLLGRAETLFR